MSAFQSHNGAIAALVRLRRGLRGRFTFNPTMVRLLLPISSIEPSAFLSIPQWCDCCEERLERALKELLLSIPQWCDCCK